MFLGRSAGAINKRNGWSEEE